MDACDHHRQRIDRLTPVSVVEDRIDARVQPVGAREIPVAEAVGRVLAGEMRPHAARPETAVALRDGWAVRAEETLDAGSYAPQPFSRASEVAVGDALPAGFDAVAGLEAVSLRGGAVFPVTAIAPGEGVLGPAADARPDQALRASGERLRPIDVAVFTALGIAHVSVREPRVLVARAQHDDPMSAAIVCWLRSALSAAGAAVIDSGSGDPDAAIEHADADAVVVIGGTGSGKRDRSVDALARAGGLDVHGIAMSPGETAAFGLVGARPVLMLPGRFDAAIAVWLTLGRRMLGRLCAQRDEPPGEMAPLARKIASPIGMVEFIPVRRTRYAVEPLAAGYLPLSSFSRSDGWILIPADSEGCPAGAQVAVRPYP